MSSSTISSSTTLGSTIFSSTTSSLAPTPPLLTYTNLLPFKSKVPSPILKVQKKTNINSYSTYYVNSIAYEYYTSAKSIMYPKDTNTLVI